MWPRFDSRTRRNMWVEFLVGSRLCFEKFFSPGTPVFPSPHKPTFLSSNSIWIICLALYHEPLAREIAQALPVLLQLNSGRFLRPFFAFRRIFSFALTDHSAEGGLVRAGNRNRVYENPSEGRKPLQKIPTYLKMFYARS